MKIAVKLCSIGTFILCGLSSPAVYGQINDACSDAYPMTNGVTYSESTMQANSNGDPTPGCQANFGRGVWFAFTPSISGRITISTCGSDFDTVLQVYTGACASLTPMICNDDAGSACFAVTASVTFDGVAATTYRILTGGFNSARGNLRIIATVAPAPANDVCTNAIPLIAGVTNFMNTIGATTNGDTPLTCWTNYGRGVWFSFTPSISGTVTVSTCSSDFDTLVQAYTGACDSLTPVAGGCNDDFGPICSTNRASISFNGTAGTTYRLLAGGFAGTFGNLGIVATVIPTNDTCGSAVAMNVNTIYTLDTSGATSLGDPALGCGTNSDKGVWYTYKPAVTGPVRISTCGSDFDTVIQVFTGSCNLLSPLNCNDDFGSACATTRASTSFQATAGTAYRILVGGKNGAGGILRIITIDCVNAGAVTSQTNCPGTTANFSVSASGTGLSYQWYFKGNLLANQTNSVLSLASVTATNAGTYSVKVSGDCNSVTNSAALTIDTNTVATALINLVKCPGDSATFSTVALGTGPITFLWRKAGLEIAGETNNSLNLLSLVASNAGTYCVKVSGFCTSVTNCTTLTVLTNTTATPLTSLTLCPGSPATFTTVASGTGPFTYSWTKGGVPIAGQTSASLSIPSVVAGDAGHYCVKVSGFCTSVTNCADLTVLTNTTATPLTNVTSACLQSNANFSTVASGTGPFTYVWTKDNVVIPGANSSSLNLTDATNSAEYCVRVTGFCSAVTNCATLTVSNCPPNICVTKEIACLLPNNNCGTFGDTATGVSGDTQDPAFCYRVVVRNCGLATLKNVTVIDDKLGDLTTNFFATPTTEFAVGASITNEYKMSWDRTTTNVVIVAGQSVFDASTNGAVTATADAVAVVIDASIGCRKLVSVDGVPSDSVAILPGDGASHVIVWSVVVVNTGHANLSNIRVTDTGCSNLVVASLEVGQSITNVLCQANVTCADAPITNTVTVTADVATGTNQYCAYDINGTNITVRSECEAVVLCDKGGCRETGGGRQPGTLTYTSPAVLALVGGTPRYTTHGGQIGAPVGNETAFDPDSDCIHGRQTYVRHIKGGLVGNFQARSFDSLMCACLGCPENPGSGVIVDGLCNPGDRTCGPEPRRAGANKIAFSGVGNYTLTNGRRTPRSVLFRIDIEDRSEPGGSKPGGATPPADRYRIRIWVINAADRAQYGQDLCGFRQAIAASKANVAIQDGAPGALGTAVFGMRAPDIDDGGELERGNHQIHPMIKECTKPAHTTCSLVP